MTVKKTDTDPTWIDPDDAPEWTEAQLARAELRVGDVVVRPAAGTLTKRGRPKSASPKLLVSLRLDQAVVEKLRAHGPGWQSRVNEILRKAVEA
jgi:uncharacterized protein (DUF4415 family)